MLKIKLSRVGKKGASHYRIVVAERRSKRDGQFVAQLGIYSPQTNPAVIKLNRPALEAWLNKGARLTPTVARLIAKQ